MPSISAVIPANNEAQTVAEVVRGCGQYCREVIVIDDGSKDETAAEATEAGANTLSNPQRRGIVATIALGMKTAKSDIIVTLDADGQHDPSDIPKLVQPIEEDFADLVIGRRPTQPPLSERILGTIVNLRVKCFDIGSGFRAVNQRVAKDMQLWGNCLCGSFILEGHRVGARLTEAPITLKPRMYGHSHWPALERWTTHAEQLASISLHLRMTKKN